MNQDPGRILRRFLKDPWKQGLLQDAQSWTRILARSWKDPWRILGNKDSCRMSNHEPGSWQDLAKNLEGSLEERIPAGCRINEPGSSQNLPKMLEGSQEERILQNVKWWTPMLKDHWRKVFSAGFGKDCNRILGIRVGLIMSWDSCSYNLGVCYSMDNVLKMYNPYILGNMVAHPMGAV